MQVMIVGASARAAAESARRCGWTVRSCDLFADEDLRAIAQTRRCRDLRDAASLIADWAGTPWLYTGGIENRPALVDRIAAHSPLWGNDGGVLRRVRDPWLVARLFGQANIRVPEIQADVPRSGRWVHKDSRSSGGSGVHWQSSRSTATVRSRRSRGYWQRWQPGAPIGAVYVTDRQSTLLLGATRQLSGTRWTGARGWSYAGSLGPVPVSAERRRELERIGQVAATQFHLRGLFGVDLIDDGSNWHVLEINPRYPASLEVLEQAGNVPLLELHRLACQGPLPAGKPSLAEPPFLAGNASPIADPRGAACCGKAILYARRSLLVPATVRKLEQVADRPSAGTFVRRGQPLLTVRTRGVDLTAVEQQLRRRVRRIQRIFDL